VIAFILVRRRSGTAGTTPKIEGPKPSGRGIWDLTPVERWTAVEQRLGKNLPGNFKTIDKFEDGVATSIKSLDLKAKSYESISTLNRTVKGYIDKMAAYKGGTWSDIEIKPTAVKARSLELARISHHVD
jgi:filamentous hemagglutinin